MGIDFLDVTYRIQRTFEIEFSTQDLAGLARDNDIVAGDLYDLILAKLHLRDIGRYDIGLHYALWDEIQQVLSLTLGVPRERVELSTPLLLLFPRDTRREAWNALRVACPYRVGELGYPQIVRHAGFSLAAGMVIVEHFRLWQIVGAKWLWPFLGVLGIWMIVETYLKILSICAPLRTRFPSGMKTVKDLCRAILAANYAEIQECFDTGIDQRSAMVWRQLTNILGDALGIDCDEVSFRSRLVRDLGMS